jgi:hypothetical protein
MFYLQPNWILAFVCAFIFFAAGKQNVGLLEGGKNHSFLWAGLSIAVSAVVIRFLDAGWPLVLVAQAVLFVGIGVVRSMLDKR